MTTEAKILIVEDSQTQALKLHHCLQRRGYQPHIADSGEAALDFLKTKQPALVISDVVMPGMDGFELCVRIKDDPQLVNIPVILLTSLAEPQHILRGLEAKADYYFTKPYDTERLLGKIANLLSTENGSANGADTPALTVNLAGETHTVTSDPQVVLNLLVATYENALQQNRELSQTKAALDQLNNRLEEKLEELSESEDRFRVLVQTVPDIVFRIDCDGRFLFVNDAVEQIGYCSDELIGEHFSKIILPVDRKECSREEQLPLFIGRETGDAEAPKLFDERRSGARMTRGLEIRLQPKDMEDDIPAVLNGFPQKNVYGEVNSSGLYQLDFESRSKTFAGTVGVIRDISDKRLSAMVMEASEERLRSALVDAPVPVMLCAEDGEILQVSKVWKNLLGNTDHLQTTRNLFATPYRDGAPDIVFEELFTLTDKKDLGEYSLTTAAGLPLIWTIRAAPLPPLDDGRRLVILMATDMTEHYQSEKALRAAKEEAERASKVKGEFLANMSHEIRTPMNAIMGMTHLCQQTALSPQQKEYIRILATSAETLLGLLDDILDFSKMEANQLKMEAVAFDLAEVRNKLEAVLGNKAKDKGLSLIFNTDPRLPRQLIGDPLRLGQVLTNLVGNAVKFTENGEIVVTTEVLEISSERLTLRFTVLDSGIGISAEQQAQLFKPFSQADPSITRRFGGSGLGLIISKRLVERMGGAIDVESTPGKGSRFFFTAVFGRPAAAAGRHDLLPEALAALRVLVVDDCDSSRDIITQQMESLNMQATATPSGEEALELLAETSPPIDLVLMDWQLMGMDGIETAAKIRQDPAIDPTPKIILVSGHHQERVKQQAEQAGLDGFLVKPVRRSELLDKIAEIFAPGVSERPPTTGTATGDKGFFSLAGVRVLVVEDNEINQIVATRLLESWQIGTAIANNGSEAVEMVARERYDAVLMDIQMPVMDGLTAARTIRAQEPDGQHLPIIAMTAHAMAGDREKSLAAGMDDQVNKPVDPAQLHDILVKWLPRKVAPAQRDASPPPPQVPPQRTDEFAALEGIINIKAGLARSAGNRKLYHELLYLFRDKHGESLIEIRRSLDQRDYEAVRSQSHALKGVAGSVGAERLQSAALALELAGRAKNHAEAETALAAAATEMEVLLAAIDALPRESHQPVTATAGTSKDSGNLLATLNQLAGYLEAGDTKAIQLSRTLNERGQLSGFAEEIGALSGLIASYDFDASLEYLRDLQSRLGKGFQGSEGDGIPTTEQSRQNAP